MNLNHRLPIKKESHRERNEEKYKERVGVKLTVEGYEIERLDSTVIEKGFKFLC